MSAFDWLLVSNICRRISQNDYLEDGSRNKCPITTLHTLQHSLRYFDCALCNTHHCIILRCWQIHCQCLSQHHCGNNRTKRTLSDCGRSIRSIRRFELQKMISLLDRYLHYIRQGGVRQGAGVVTGVHPHAAGDGQGEYH